jgi:ankyrin repeat protein
MVNALDLYHAFDDGDFKTIDSFAAEYGVNWQTANDKWNLLHMALLSVSEPPRPDVIKHLIELGVDVNAKDRESWTPLHFAARTKSPAVVRLLVDAGADVNAERGKGVTAIHESVLTFPSNLEVFEIFLAAGAKTDRVRNYLNAIASPDKAALLALIAKYDTPDSERRGST